MNLKIKSKTKTIVLTAVGCLLVAGALTGVVCHFTNGFKEPIATSVKFADIKFEDLSVIKDGAKHTIKVQGLDEGQTASIYLTNNSTAFEGATDYGEYYLKAVVKIDDVSRDYFATLKITDTNGKVVAPTGA